MVNQHLCRGLFVWHTFLTPSRGASYSLGGARLPSPRRIPPLDLLLLPPLCLRRQNVLACCCHGGTDWALVDDLFQASVHCVWQCLSRGMVKIANTDWLEIDLKCSRNNGLVKECY